jgi:predicted phage tail protein
MNDLPMIAGAGGGCFARGTQVQLEHGKTVAIEDIKVGDEILSFDEEGNLHVAKVEKLHVHAPLPILRVKFWRGEVFITPNHWVLNQYSSFVEIQTLSIEDALVDGMGHLRPIISFESAGVEPVYNLTVEKYHTFIANNIRVHNGGHRETYPVVAGAMGGGGKGGGGRAAREDPESLQSKALVSILDLLGEGQIGGLLNGAQSIYFNETPLQNPDGSYNFAGVTWEARYGLPNQTYIPNYADVETPFTVNVQCKTISPVTFTVTNPNADRVRIIVTIPSLTSSDVTTGDLHGTSVEYLFQISTNGGPYQNVIADYIWGAATIGTSSGNMSVTATDPNASHVSCVINLDASGTIDYRNFTWGATAVVQPQVWNGSTWVNYGSTITISSDPYADSFASRMAFIYGTQKSQLVKTAYTDLPGSAARFVVISLTSGATLSLTDPRAYAGNPNIVVSGKTRSRYQRSHLITLPKPGTTWNIRMVRLTADNTSSALTNDTYLDTYVEIVDSKIAYVNSAVVGVTIDSSLFNKIPTRAYLVNGLYIQIPTNYDPVTRTYSGTWNGTFKVGVSNSPAWILYDLLTNTRYGLGQYIGATNINKAALYQIGKYCDELVPDGFGGTEPRFVINTVIQSQAEAYKLITDISSVFQGMSYWAGGMVGFMQDSPRDPSMIYGRANVIDGMFNYAGSARKDRHSVVHVTWNDPLDGYKQKIEYVEDALLVAKYGIRKTEVVAFGCTSRGQANRVGRWILYTEQYESALITFGVGLDSALVMPGEVIRINDPTRAGKRMAGRLMGITATSATLDAPVNLTSTAEISFILPDGSFVDRPVLQGIGSHTTLTWTTPLTTMPLLNAMFIVAETNLTPLLARVIGISQDENNKNQYLITAVEHNPFKYGAIENGWTLTKPVTSIIKSKPDAPTNLVLTDILYQSGANYASKLHASWDADYEGTVKGWNVRLLGPSNTWQDFGTIKYPSLEVPNVIDGQNYRIEVRAVNALGIQSDATTATRTILGKEGPPSNVTGLTAVENELGVKISWIRIGDIDIAYYEVREGTDWETATFVGSVNNDFIDLPPQSAGLHTWLVRARDTTDHYSLVDGVVTLNVGLPATPEVTAIFVGTTVEVGWPAITNADSYYVEIWADGLLRRSFNTTLNFFSYTIEIATADGGPWRQITAKVKAQKGSVLGAAGEATSDVNLAPPAPSMILVSGIGAVSITVSKCEEDDYAGTLIHASQTSGFTLSEDNLIYEGDTFYLQSGIEGTWYYKAAHYDAFGKSSLNYSTEMSEVATNSVAGITTVTSLPANPAAVSGQLAIFLDVEDTAVRGIYGWDGIQWTRTGDLLDGSITYEKFDPDLLFDIELEQGEIVTEHLADGAVKYQKIDPELELQIEVEAGEIKSTHIADDAITTPKLMAGAVIAAKIAADQITSNHLQSDSVTALKIAAGAVVSDKILANQILSAHIQSDAILATHILAGQVTAEKIAVSDLSAITANMGSITSGSLTIDISGYVKGGQTAYNSGTGFWLGYNAGNYKFSLGSSSGNRLTWDGTTLFLAGNINLGTTNFIAAGQNTYGVGKGFWLGYSGGFYKLSIGDPAGKALFWDGSNLTVQGDIIATGNINANAVTKADYSFTQGGIWANNSAWTSAASLTVSKTTTNPTIILCYMLLSNNESGLIAERAHVRFLRDGVVIQTFMNVIGNAATGTGAESTKVRPWYFQYVDVGAAGTHTYSFQFFSDNTNHTRQDFQAWAYSRSLIAMELKR